MRTCDVEGCDKKVKARGLCSTHHTRLMRHGDPNKTLYNAYNGTEPSYRALHMRLSHRYGKASNYECSICGGPADEWAVVREWVEPQDLLTETDEVRTRTYSRCDWDYTTLCVPHHRSYDYGSLNLDEWLVA